MPKERRVVWVNKHRLVKENKAIAGKTGYTSVAGRTLSTEFAEGEKRPIVATLGDRDDWKSHMHLSRHTFETTTLEQIEGTYLAAQNIMITVSRPFRYLQKKEEPISHQVILSRGSTRGEWSIRAGDQVLRFPVIYRMK